MKFLVTFTAVFAAVASAGTVLWDGRLNEYSDASFLDQWSWGNQVGPYQYYIHGSGPTSRYVSVGQSYKNPADTNSNGIKVTIDSTALWNSDMWRTELIPQTKSNLGSGRLFYHFSMSRKNTNPPNPNFEHQVNFFESHFTEMKYGWINGQPVGPDNTLKWCVGGVPKWSVTWEADIWHNFAYDINFSSNTVSLWHSTGGNPLVQVVGPQTASTSTNSADWHLGVLRLPDRQNGMPGGGAEDWYFSGVYVESGTLTTTIGNGSNPPPVSSSTIRTHTTISTSTSTRSSTSTSTTRTTSTVSPTPTTGTGPVVQKWGQCGGIGYTGPTTCAAGSTCMVSNPYYSQCL